MLQKSTMRQVLEVFFSQPTKKHYLKQLSREMGIAHTVVKEHLETLKKEGIIKQENEKRGSRIFPNYQATIENRTYRRLKKIHNFSSIQAVAEELNNMLSPQSIVLFGSYQRGEDIEGSDIDLYVQCSKEEVPTNIFEKKLQRPIQLHFHREFRNLSEELRNNIINGIVLQGYLEALS